MQAAGAERARGLRGAGVRAVFVSYVVFIVLGLAYFMILGILAR